MGFALFTSSCDLILDPVPGKADYFLRLENVIRTEADTRSDSEGTNHTSFYVYVSDSRRDSGERRMTVSKETYDAITEPGYYYFAMATSGKINIQFDIYPKASFEPAPDIEVRHR